MSDIDLSEFSDDTGNDNMEAQPFNSNQIEQFVNVNPNENDNNSVNENAPNYIGGNDDVDNESLNLSEFSDDAGNNNMEAQPFNSNQIEQFVNINPNDNDNNSVNENAPNYIDGNDDVDNESLNLSKFSDDAGNNYMEAQPFNSNQIEQFVNTNPNENDNNSVNENAPNFINNIDNDENDNNSIDDVGIHPNLANDQDQPPEIQNEQVGGMSQFGSEVASTVLESNSDIASINDDNIEQDNEPNNNNGQQNNVPNNNGNAVRVPKQVDRFWTEEVSLKWKRMAYMRNRIERDQTMPLEKKKRLLKVLPDPTNDKDVENFMKYQVSDAEEVPIGNRVNAKWLKIHNELKTQINGAEEQNDNKPAISYAQKALVSNVLHEYMLAQDNQDYNVTTEQIYNQLAPSYGVEPIYDNNDLNNDDLDALSQGYADIDVNDLGVGIDPYVEEVWETWSQQYAPVDANDLGVGINNVPNNPNANNQMMFIDDNDDNFDDIDINHDDLMLAFSEHDAKNEEPQSQYVQNQLANGNFSDNQKKQLNVFKMALEEQQNNLSVDSLNNDDVSVKHEQANHVNNNDVVEIENNNENAMRNAFVEAAQEQQKNLIHENKPQLNEVAAVELNDNDVNQNDAAKPGKKAKRAMFKKHAEAQRKAHEPYQSKLRGHKSNLHNPTKSKTYKEFKDDELLKDKQSKTNKNPSKKLDNNQMDIN